MTISVSRETSLVLLDKAAEELGAVIASLSQLGDSIGRAHRLATDAGRDTTRSDFLSLRPAIGEHLRRHHALVTGMGVLARPGLLTDAAMFVEWWCVGSGEPFLLRVSLDPEHPVFSDYDTFEWFEGPWRMGASRVVGPWVDFTGTGEHVLTLSVPIFSGRGEEFLGVAGADVPVGRIEDLAIPTLIQIKEDAALINSDGRVIASNTSRLLTGSLLPGADALIEVSPANGWRLRDGVGESENPALPWAVVIVTPA